MKIHILVKIICEGYYSRYYTPLMDTGAGYNWFSKFDCKSGFYHLKLNDESKNLTAFNVPQGFYEWNVLPFGYKNAPGRFQCFMDTYFNKLENCVVYIDDILLYSKNKEQHIELLTSWVFLNRFRV